MEGGKGRTTARARGRWRRECSEWGELQAHSGQKEGGHQSVEGQAGGQEDGGGAAQSGRSAGCARSIGRTWGELRMHGECGLIPGTVSSSEVSAKKANGTACVLRGLDWAE